MNKSYIVVCSTEEEKYIQDQWRHFESYQDAKNWYEHLLTVPNLYSASICTPIESTDYD